jgi:hypothetical protein
MSRIEEFSVAASTPTVVTDKATRREWVSCVEAWGSSNVYSCVVTLSLAMLTTLAFGVDLNP